MSEEVKTAVAVGHVIGWSEPQEGKRGPSRCFVGGIELSMWKTVKDEDGDPVKNAIRVELKKHADDNTAVKVKYEITEQKSKDGERTFTNNTPIKVATDDVDADEVTKGDKVSEEAKAKRQAGGGNRKGGWSDEEWVAARWACSTVLDGMGEGVNLGEKKIQDAIKKNAIILGTISLGVRDELKKLRAAGKAEGPSNKAADAEPEKKDDVPF